MTRVLLTGMSATGKSTLIRELLARGHRAIDADTPAWSVWMDAVGNPTGAMEGKDWVWREDRIGALLAGDDAGILFVAGCAANMGSFLPRFDRVVLLSAPAETILERLARRTDNPYGRRAEEVAQVLVNLREVEPRLRRIAHHEIDASAPLDEVLGHVLRIADA